jgi:hypothetical protein
MHLVSPFQTAHLVPAARFPRPGFCPFASLTPRKGWRSAERTSASLPCAAWRIARGFPVPTSERTSSPAVAAPQAQDMGASAWPSGCASSIAPKVSAAPCAKPAALSIAPAPTSPSSLSPRVRSSRAGARQRRATRQRRHRRASATSSASSASSRTAICCTRRGAAPALIGSKRGDHHARHRQGLRRVRQRAVRAG